MRVMRTTAGKAQETVLSGAGISDAPIPARLGWQAVDGKLRLGWGITIDEASEAPFWEKSVDAQTGEVLHTDDWTSHDDPDDLEERLDREAEAPLAPAFQPAFDALALSPTPVTDGSAYRVFAWPNESPND